MKDSSSSFICPVSTFFFVLSAIMVSSCAHEPQRLLFSNHPTEYQKAKSPAAALVTPNATEVPLTASTTAEPVAALPENTYLPTKVEAKALATELTKLKNATPQETGKITRKEKITTLKTALKEVKAARKEIKQIKKADTKKVQAAGPVTNDVAVKIVIIGLILILLGLIVPFLYGLGGLVVVIGLVLLLLNYL